MKLCQVMFNQKVKIKKIETQENVSKRLYEMGLYVGAYVVCVKYSLFKSSILIATATSKLVLRSDLAEKIEVEYV